MQKAFHISEPPVFSLSYGALPVQQRDVQAWQVCLAECQAIVQDRVLTLISYIYMYTYIRIHIYRSYLYIYTRILRALRARIGSHHQGERRPSFFYRLNLSPLPVCRFLFQQAPGTSLGQSLGGNWQPWRSSGLPEVSLGSWRRARQGQVPKGNPGGGPGKAQVVRELPESQPKTVEVHLRTPREPSEEPQGPPEPPPPEHPRTPGRVQGEPQDLHEETCMTVAYGAKTLN